MPRWLSDDTGVPFIVKFSSAQAELGNSDGYGENINCIRKSRRDFKTRALSACLYADDFENNLSH